jgi:amidase
MAEFWQLSACEVTQLIRDRKASAVEITQSALTRLEAVNPEINAIVQEFPEEALSSAQSVDERIARGEDCGVLCGVPVTVKVNVDQCGHATTNGLRLQRDLVASVDNPVVANLRRAGAFIIGRTNTPAFSLRWFTRNSLHGHTRNPRNPDLTPGGSSGGMAAFSRRVSNSAVPSLCTSPV